MTLCPALLVTARHFRFISSRKNKDRGETTRNHSFTAVRFYRNLFPSALRSSDAAVTHCLRMSPDLRISTQIPPSQNFTAADRSPSQWYSEDALPSYSGGTVQDLHLLPS